MISSTWPIHDVNDDAANPRSSNSSVSISSSAKTVKVTNRHVTFAHTMEETSVFTESELEIIRAVWHAISPRLRTSLSLSLYLLKNRQIEAAEEGTEYFCSDILSSLERDLRRNKSSDDRYARNLSALLEMVPRWSIGQMEEVRSFSGQDNGHAASDSTGSTVIIATPRTLATANSSLSSTALTVESKRTGSAISSITADACVSDGVARRVKDSTEHCSMM